MTVPEENNFKLDVVSVRLVKDAPIYSSHKMRTPEDAVAVLGDIMCEFDREVLCVVNMRADCVPINVHFASMGIIDATITCPRELLKAGILSNAANMMMLHNHVSGRLVPSRDDILLTRRINEACAIIGIDLVDHIIVGGDNSEYFSFHEKGLLTTPTFGCLDNYRKKGQEIQAAEREDGQIRR